jgi:hypothetical protein
MRWRKKYLDERPTRRENSTRPEMPECDTLPAVGDGRAASDSSRILRPS